MDCTVSFFFFFFFTPTAVGLGQVCSDSSEFSSTYRTLLRETPSMWRVVAGARGGCAWWQVPGVPLVHVHGAFSYWSVLGLPSWEKMLFFRVCCVVFFSPPAVPEIVKAAEQLDSSAMKMPYFRKRGLG